MKRRDFLQRAASLVALGVAADQLELLERLAHTRTVFPGWRAPSLSPALKLLNGFQHGYTVSGRDWRFDREGFAFGAKLTGREVRHDLALDAYVVGPATRQAFMFAPPTTPIFTGPGPLGGSITRGVAAVAPSEPSNT
jgi:hypothetical protein